MTAESKSLLNELSRLVDQYKATDDYTDESGWHPFPDAWPEEPAANPDDMPSVKDYPVFEAFRDARFEWVDSHLPRYLIWTRDGQVPTIAFWGGNNYDRLDAYGNQLIDRDYKSCVIAWQELPEAPTFREVA